MENKKELIIIPPMSQALQKLHEVLEGIAGEENIDISIIDDLKELGQVLASTGQCLILCSNPKKCATFLQENRFVISRFHSKTILLTPQEIPAKTLVKFTKVGLTESILENSAPKTLLYKIKLQLRSIKSSAKEEDKEKDKEVVKSMIDINADVNAAYEEEKIHHEFPLQQEQPQDEGHKNVHDLQIEFEHGENNKKKNTHNEDVIATHWKTKRKQAETSLDLDFGEQKKEEEINIGDINQYYRGDLKKNTTLSLEESDIYSKKKNNVEEISIEGFERKKSSYQDVISEELMRHDSTYVPEDENTNAPLKVKPGEGDISIAMEKTRKETEQEQAYDKDRSKKTDNLTEIELSPAARAKRNTEEEKEEVSEELLQDKITAIDLEIDKPRTRQDFLKNEYDNGDEIQNGENQTEIEFSKEKQKKQQTEVETDSEKNKIKKDSQLFLEEGIDGEISTEHIDAFLRKGKNSLQREANTEIDFEKENKKSDAPNYEHDDDNNQKSNLTELDLQSAKKKNDEKSYENNEDELKDQVVSELIKLDHNTQNKNDDKPSTDGISDYDRQNIVRTNEVNLDLIDDKERDNAELTSRDVNFKKLSNTQIEFEKSKNSKSEGYTEKIDTYYRTPDAQKSDQDWDFGKSQASTEIALLHNKKADINLGPSFQSKDAGEITIDYRKLKEEFDLISRGETTGSSDAITKSTSADIDPDDEGTFKVIEVNTRGIELSISILNMIYQKNIKPKQIYALIAEEMLVKYSGTTVFWDYKASSKKHEEVYNSYLELVHAENTIDKKEWWLEFKKDKDLFEHYQSRTMSTWRCSQIMDKNSPWEDVELPTWAKNELSDKTVELAFPYFDGVDRMGLALVIFHNGLKAEDEHSILTSLEMARHLLLDTIQRSSVNHSSHSNEQNEETENKDETNKKVLNFFGGLFGKKKAG